MFGTCFGWAANHVWYSSSVMFRTPNRRKVRAGPALRLRFTRWWGYLAGVAGGLCLPAQLGHHSHGGLVVVVHGDDLATAPIVSPGNAGTGFIRVVGAPLVTGRGPLFRRVRWLEPAAVRQSNGEHRIPHDVPLLGRIWGELTTVAGGEGVN